MKSYKEIKKIYNKISFRNSNLTCPKINNEKVYFNYAGLKHLIRKGGKTRSLKQVNSRVGLLRYIENIVCAQSSSIEYRTSHYQENFVEYWGLAKTIKSKKTVTVILRRRNGGRLHFYSIFHRK